MLIAVMSDSHDNKKNIKKALNIIAKRGCNILIHCGDFSSPSILYEFREFSGKVYGVFGNNDYDVLSMKEIALEEVTNIEFMGFEAELELYGELIAFTHYPETAEGLAMGGDYSAVFCGHTHIYDIKKYDRTFLINPGEIFGETGICTFVFYEFNTDVVEKVIL